MKKIFILFGLLSVLLCSCASKPADSTKSETTTQNNKAEVDEFFNQYYWTAENYVLKNEDHLDDEKVYSKMHIDNWSAYYPKLSTYLESKFKEIINLPEISGEDFLLLSRIDNMMYAVNDLYLDYYWVHLWFKSFLRNKEINNNTFTVKFTNTTDETFHLKIHTNSPWRWYKVDIKPHEEKYFTLPDMEENTFLSFEDDNNYHLFTYVGFEGCACNEGYEYSKYLFSNYSLDFSFNPNNIIQKPGHTAHYYDWKLVPRYEKEDNVIKHYLDRSNQVLPANTENLGK